MSLPANIQLGGEGLSRTTTLAFLVVSEKENVAR
jgi:hypothetical protein